MKNLKNYEKPLANEIVVGTTGMLANSPSLRYTNEAADKNSEVLVGKQRGDWGDVWK